MRTFMAAIVGLVIIGTAARAQDKAQDKKDTPAAPAEKKDSHGGLVGSHEGKVLGVSPDGSFVIIADKKGREHKMHIGANTQVTADGKAVEGGVKNLKVGSNVTISWHMDPQGNRVGTVIRVMQDIKD